MKKLKKSEKKNMIKEHFTALGNNSNNSSLINHLQRSVNNNSSHDSFDVIGTIGMVIN